MCRTIAGVRQVPIESKLDKQDDLGLLRHVPGACGFDTGLLLRNLMGICSN